MSNSSNSEKCANTKNAKSAAMSRDKKRRPVMVSCHVTVCNLLSLSMGSQGVAAGANPSLVSGRGQGTPWTSRQLIAGPSLMSNVGFSISLKDTSTCSSALPRASDLLIASRPALPAELQSPPSHGDLCQRVKRRS